MRLGMKNKGKLARFGVASKWQSLADAYQESHLVELHVTGVT